MPVTRPATKPTRLLLRLPFNVLWRVNRQLIMERSELHNQIRELQYTIAIYRHLTARSDGDGR